MLGEFRFGELEQALVAASLHGGSAAALDLGKCAHHAGIDAGLCRRLRNRGVDVAGKLLAGG
jgi:hypothetical protein